MFKLFFFTLALSTFLLAAEGECTIIVENIEKSEGTIAVGIFNTKESFGKHSESLFDLNLNINSTQVDTTISLPKGEYAIAVYHDINGNKKLDKNMFTAPTEPYGFSNNKYGSMGRPKYDLSKFTIAADTTVIQKIVLR